MSDIVHETAVAEAREATLPHSADELGQAFLKALETKDFDGLEKLYKADVRFRATVPSGERLGKTSLEAAKWYRRWFGDSDFIQILHSDAAPLFNRFYMSYRLRLHDKDDGWRLIEQQAYCDVQDGQIADMWLICTGFSADPAFSKERRSGELQPPQPHLGGDIFYDAGSKGCAEGPMEEIARLLSPLAPGQTLEIYATDPSITADLSAWCRLSGHVLAQQDGHYFLIQHK